MTPVILADENIPGLVESFGAWGELRPTAGRGIRAAQLADVDVLLVRSVTRVDEALLRGSPVRFVGTATAGIDHVDCHYLQDAGIGFASAAGANANSVVEYVLAAIAAVGDKLEALLAGGSVGIAGYGHIGRALAQRLDRLGVRCRVYDPWLAAGAVSHAADLGEVMRCEVVTLHTSLVREQPWPSYHLLDAAALASLPPGCLLINSSRGPVVDNRALLACLDAGQSLQVVLDVWEGEPHIDRRLLERVSLGSAHIAGYSYDGKLRGTAMLAAALAAFLGVEATVEATCDPPEPVTLDAAGLDRAGFLRSLLQARYDIRRDDELLRTATSADDPGAAFDMLRKSYRQRRELAASPVLASGLTAGQLTLLEALGCRPVRAAAG